MAESRGRRRTGIRTMKPSRNALQILLCLLIGSVLAVAGGLKAWDPPEFADVLARRGWMPALFIPAVAVGLPWVEIVAAIALIFLPRYRAGAALLMTVFFMLFAVEIAIGVMLGWQAPCGCFGAGDRPAGWGHVVMNLALAAGCVKIYLYRRQGEPCRERNTAAQGVS